jgi:hypothetical protein
MPEEKLTINEGTASPSGPDEATKEKISESVLAKAKRKSGELQEKVKENFLTSPQETFYKNLKKDGLKGESGRKDFYDQKRAMDDSGDKGQDFPDKFGEDRKQYIQSSEMERRKNKMQANKEKSLIKRRPQSLVRQMSSLQANRNMALREGVREIREGDKMDDAKKGQENIEEKGNDARLKAGKQTAKVDQKTSLKIEQTSKGGKSKIKLATDNILKSMIRIVIPSWSISMFYVYLHVFLRNIFPDYFSKLGHEWVPINIKKNYPEQAEKIGDKIGIAEKPAVGCCCVVHLFILIIIVAIIYFILNPLEVLWNFLVAMAQVAWGYVEGWLD